jgi:hypothetical protein
MDRRVFMVGTAGAGLALSGCGQDEALATAMPLAQGRGAPPMLPPIAQRYRTELPRLFLVPPAGVVAGGSGGSWVTPGRDAIAAPKSAYNYGTTGPTATHVDVGSDWRWARKNGDWVDAKGVAYGEAPHWRCNAGSRTGSVGPYVVDATSGVQAALAPQRWNAYIVRCAGGRCAMATNWNATPPHIEVQYVDGTAGKLSCLAGVLLEPSSAYSQAGSPEVDLRDGRHAVLEFEKPLRDVRKAMLHLPVEDKGGAWRLSAFLADPPRNKEAVMSGLAQAYPRDDGIRAHRDVIFAHRYQDGTKASDWIEQKDLNVYNKAFWSPHVFDGRAEKDTSKLPFVNQGRWVKVRKNATLVPSNYQGEGFAPLAPGIGALRVNTPGRDAADGAVVGDGGGFGCDLAMYLPDDLCGVLDEIYIRYYLRLGVQPPEFLKDIKMYRAYEKSASQYAVHEGKFGIGASHWTHYGGNNNIGGGNIGWTNRNAFKEYPADVVGGGLRPGVHSWDMLGYNGYWGQQGGLGAALYPGHWYCIESRLKLNTVDTSRSPFDADPSKNLDDAEMDIWLDGRKVLEMRNFSYRRLPLNYGSTGKFDRKTRMGPTPIERKYLVPIRQLGVTAITLNDYNGGLLPASTDRAKFYAGLVVSKSPIGAMAGL